MFHTKSPSVSHTPTTMFWLPGTAGVLLIMATSLAIAAGMHADHDTGDLHVVKGQDEANPHAHHRHMLENKAYNRSEHDYRLPDLTVVDMNGENGSLLEAINADQPVMLNFIFTTCTTICPVLSATFSQVQRELGDRRERVRMISITIDPEHDTPERLHAYAARFNAGPQWQFLTGDLDDIVSIQKVFDAYRGAKTNHVPLTFLRASSGASWVRLEGLASTSDVIKEYEKLIKD